MPKREAIYQKWYDWEISPLEERQPPTQKELARELGCTEQTLINWRKKLTETVPLDLEARIQRMDDSLYNDAMKTGATAKMKELWYKRFGLLVDKSEQKVKFELTADEHFSIREEARRRISEVSGRAN